MLPFTEAGDFVLFLTAYVLDETNQERIISNVPYRPPLSLRWPLNNAGEHQVGVTPISMSAVSNEIAKESMNPTPSCSSSPEDVAETSPPSEELQTSLEAGISKQPFQPSETEFLDKTLMLTCKNKDKSTLKSSENTDLPITSNSNFAIARKRSGSNMMSFMSPLSSWNADNDLCSINESTFPENIPLEDNGITSSPEMPKSHSLATNSKITSTCGSLPYPESCYTPKAMKSRKSDPIESSFISLSSALQAHLENRSPVESADVEKKVPLQAMKFLLN